MNHQPSELYDKIFYQSHKSIQTIKESNMKGTESKNKLIITAGL